MFLILTYLNIRKENIFTILRRSLRFITNRVDRETITNLLEDFLKQLQRQLESYQENIGNLS